MPRRHPLPPPLELVPFSVRRARALDVTPGRLRSPDLVIPFRGARLHVGAVELRDRCAALQSVLGSESAFVGPTAARLHGMPLPSAFDAEGALHVSTLAGRRAPRRDGVIGSRRPGAWSVQEFNAVRVVGAVETWMSLAGHLSRPDLVAVADFLLGPTAGARPATRRAQMSDSLRSAGARRGIRDLRIALDLAREGVRSRPESHLRLVLADVGPREPAVAVPVRVGPGRFAHPDLSWPEWRVAVEYDGAGHRDSAQHAIDVARHEELIDVGWSVLHVVAGDLYRRPSLVVARVLRRLRAAGWVEPRAELTRFAQLER